MSISGENIGECLLLTGPAADAVDSDRLKEHLELTHNQDDSLVFDAGGYLPSATADIENMADLSMITQSRRQILNSDEVYCLSGRTIKLSFGPVQSITEVKYLDADEAEQTLSTDNYRANLAQSSVYFKGALPGMASGPGVLWVDYVAGFGDASTDVPSEWQNIIMTLAFHKYDNRGGGIDHKFWRMIEYRVCAAGGSRRL